jgi:hypothetical protein
VTDAAGVRVRLLAAEDLDEADRICRVAFGTFVGVPRPERFFGDADLVRTRWQADPGAALAAELDGRVAGSNFAANWGSVGFFAGRGFRRDFQGVTMHRPNEPGYSTSDSFVIDDWR